MDSLVIFFLVACPQFGLHSLIYCTQFVIGDELALANNIAEVLFPQYCVSNIVRMRTFLAPYMMCGFNPDKLHATLPLNRQ